MYKKEDVVIWNLKIFLKINSLLIVLSQAPFGTETKTHTVN